MRFPRTRTRWTGRRAALLVAAAAAVAPLSWAAQPETAAPETAPAPVNPTATPVFPARDAAIDKGEFLGHVKHLSDEGFRGREAGTEDQLKAARYIADEFKRFGLKAWGDEGKDGAPRSYFQTFQLPTSDGIGKDTVLTCTTGGATTFFDVGKQFAPLVSGKADAKGMGKLVFAGYGIHAPEYDFNDFENVDLKGKWALVLRYEPNDLDPNSKFAGKQHTQHATFASKLTKCFMRKAAGVLIVAGPRGRELEPELLPSGKGPPMADFNAPVFVITREVADQLLKPSGKTIADLQKAIDADYKNHSFELDRVLVNGVSDLDWNSGATSNVLGLLEGRDPKAKDEVLVLGAHCDHVGMGRFGSLLGKAGVGKIHYGADDNASGTAGLLEVAQYFAALPPDRRPRRSILFMAFSGEEKGLLGSQYFVDHPTVPLKDIVTMVNLDMIGRSVNGQVTISGVGTGKNFRELVEKHTARQPGLRVYMGSGGETPSDNTTFYRKNIPVLFFFTGTHPDYHRPTDTWEKINAAAAASIVHVVKDVCAELAEQEDRPSFQREDQRGYLGVGVDRAKVRTAKGFPVGRLESNSPASRAGLESGDLIVEMNGKAILAPRDLPMAMLGYAPGDSVYIKVRRGEATKDFTIKLSSQGDSGRRPPKGRPAPEKPKLDVPLTEKEKEAMGLGK